MSWDKEPPKPTELRQTGWDSEPPDSFGKSVKEFFVGENYDWSNAPKDFLKTNVDALPAYGQALGSLINPAAAGAGQAAGNSLKKGINDLAEKPLSDNFRLPTREQIAEVAFDALHDFNEGAVSDMAGQGASKVLPVAVSATKNAIQKSGEAAETVAARLAARRIGAERGTIKKLGFEKVDEAGRYALDNKLMTPFSSTEDIIANNEAVKKKGGGMMREVYTAIDEQGAAKINPKDLANAVQDELGGFYNSPINKGETRQLKNTVDSILARSKGAPRITESDIFLHKQKEISLSQAQELKEELSKVANWKNNINITEKEQMARDAYKVVSKHIDDAVEAGAEKIGSEDLLNTLREGKDLYSKGKSAETLLENKQAAEKGNQLVKLTDWGTIGAGGAATAVTGGAAAAPALAFFGLKKYGEKYGLQQTALALDSVSKNLLSIPKYLKLSQSKPEVFGQIVTRLTQMSLDDNAPVENTEVPKKGPAKWKRDGEAALLQQDPELDLSLVKSSPKGEELLFQASGLKPGSKAMMNLVTKIKSFKGGK